MFLGKASFIVLSYEYLTWSTALGESVQVQFFAIFVIELLVIIFYYYEEIHYYKIT